MPEGADTGGSQPQVLPALPINSVNINETSYDINKAFSVSSLFAFVRQERIIQTLSASEDIAINNGIGDGIILLRYNFLRGEKYPDADFMFGAGPKFPLGKANFRDNRGISLPADLQPGTGAWDAMLWTNFTRRALIRETLSFNLTATYRATGTNSDFNGSQAYKFGNEFQVQVATSQYLKPICLYRRL